MVLSRVITHSEIVLHMTWLLSCRQALKSSLDTHIWMTTGMLVSESLNTGVLQNSFSMSCHKYCQVMFLCSSCLNGSIKDVSQNMCCAQNLILSWTFCNHSCPVEVPLMMETSAFCHLAWIQKMSINPLYFCFIMNQIVPRLIFVFSAWVMPSLSLVSGHILSELMLLFQVFKCYRSTH